MIVSFVYWLFLSDIVCISRESSRDWCCDEEINASDNWWWKLITGTIMYLLVLPSLFIHCSHSQLSATFIIFITITIRGYTSTSHGREHNETLGQEQMYNNSEIGSSLRLKYFAQSFLDLVGGTKKFCLAFGSWNKKIIE